MSIEALLFDIDGTMTETDPAHFASFNAVLKGLREPITFEEYNANIHGMAEEDVKAWLFPDPENRPCDIVAVKEAHFRDQVTTLTPFDGLVSLLDKAETRGIPFAAVTNAPRDNAETMLAAMGLRDRFDVVISGMDLPRPKPDPMPFEEGAKALGVNPKACFAFEDSVTGIISAAAAGCTVYAMAAAIAPERQKAAGAHYLIDNYADQGLLAEFN